MLYGRHQKETILNQMPDGFKDIAKQSAGSVRGDMIPVPDLDKHVFCRVLADRGYVEMNNAGYVLVVQICILPDSHFQVCLSGWIIKKCRYNICGPYTLPEKLHCLPSWCALTDKPCCIFGCWVLRTLC